ncbi:DUF29 family protein [Nostoc sp. DSM 114160]|jgi:hypothetical protein
MKSIKLQILQTLYEQDFYAWVEQTAELLRSHHWGHAGFRTFN